MNAHLPTHQSSVWVVEYKAPSGQWLPQPNYVGATEQLGNFFLASAKAMTPREDSEFRLTEYVPKGGAS